MSLNDGKLYGVDLRLRKKGEGQLAVAVLPYGALPARLPRGSRQLPVNGLMRSRGIVATVGRDTIEDAGTPEEALQTFVGAQTHNFVVKVNCSDVV